MLVSAIAVVLVSKLDESLIHESQHGQFPTSAPSRPLRRPSPGTVTEDWALVMLDPQFNASPDATPANEVFKIEEPTEVNASTELRDDADAATQPETLTVSNLHVPGPGLLEAGLWWIGFLVTHVVAGIGMMIVYVVWKVVTSGIDFGDPAATKGLIEGTLKEPAIGPILGEMLIFVAVAIVAGLLRIGRNPLRKLGTTSISGQHLVLIIGGAFPLMIFCGSLHHHLNAAWDALLKAVPSLQMFDTTNINTFMATLKDVPIPLLLLAIAVCPAVGEEIIFRGVIGRGLVARYGVVIGVLLTSCFFAFAHIHPAHSLAVLPLGIYLHVAYLSTRSWVAPVLVHFINNAVAVGMMQVADRLQGNKLADDAAQPAWVIAVTGCIAFGTMVALWKSRIEYRDEHGENWDPGYQTVEQPPQRVAAVPVMRPSNPLLYGTAMSAGCLLTGVFVLGIAGAIAQETLQKKPVEAAPQQPAAVSEDG